MMEENAQMSLLPDAAVAAQMTMTGEEEIDLSEYEIVRPEFFAHIKEPAFTLYLIAACVTSCFSA